MCDKGLKSGRAVNYLKGKGYHAKLLLGGIDNLEGLVELKYNDNGLFWFIDFDLF